MLLPHCCVVVVVVVAVVVVASAVILFICATLCFIPQKNKIASKLFLEKMNLFITLYHAKQITKQ